MTLTNGRDGPELMSAFIAATRAAPPFARPLPVGDVPVPQTLDLKREPVGDDLRTRVALERRERPVDR